MMSHLDQLHKSVCYSGLSLVLLLVGVLGVQAQTGQRFKRIDYHYDLISGKVNEVHYQANQPDAFYHKYEYDADNRITKVHTSKDSISWDQDASYTYYAHGPLARVEFADNKVQGLDYAYTLQGWIKGVNSNLLKAENDIGNDGLSGSAHSRVAKDAFGYSLNYHANDYKPIDAANWSNTALRFEALTPNSDLMAARFDLYNGNISSMVTTIVEPKVYTGAANEVPNILPQGTAYKYDQLNRLLEMKAFQNLDVATNTWKQGSTYTGLYHNTFKYDANGNILGQFRADQTGKVIDSLTYKYAKDALGHTKQNRLYHVKDQVNPLAFTDDIDDQGPSNTDYKTANNGSNNYTYDEIGNLSSDKQEGIAKIEWTVYGKIKSITRTAVSLRSDLEFQYDASGNRVAKIEKPRDANGLKPASEWIATYYARDAQGNVMGIYKHRPLAVGASFKLMERNIFGGSRLGSDYSEVELINALPVANPLIRVLGNKHFEGSNHLGNVLAVVSDRKIPRDDDGNGVIEYFQAEVLSANDYSPFGVVLDGRDFGVEGRYGFNGKEKDDEVKGEGNSLDFGARIYDSRLGRWLSTDPEFTKYSYFSPYNSFGDNPLFYIDPEGDTIARFDGKGKYLGLIELDKNGFEGQMGDNGQILRNFAFNDLGDDKGRVLSGAASIKVMHGTDVDRIVETTNTQFENSKKNKYLYALTESTNRDSENPNATMDYLSKLNLTDGTDAKTNTFYLADDRIAYNNQDFGNYLWGATMKKIGISKVVSKFAAHVNSFLKANANNEGNRKYKPTKWYQFRQKIDSQGDQRAIEKGHNSQHNYDK